ncbi:MAG: hypothetical protein JEZ07_01270 [Phycisphaerae bacterium]|nr:hypothetical protein [Phycisphaerae bacterium]
MNSQEIINIFQQASRANVENINRFGNVIKLNGPGKVVVSGDVHGHDRNFERLVCTAAMDSDVNNHLIAHELIHCNEPVSATMCHSYKLLLEAAMLKIRYPNQFHFLMGNHAMAQITQDEVLKNGQPMVRSFNAGIEDVFGSDAKAVYEAMQVFLMTLPIACRTNNKIWMSHSLPAMRNLAAFDSSIFDEPITLDVLKNNRSLRALIWDRRHCSDCVEQLQQMWDIEAFVVGHQPQVHGCCKLQKGLIVIASDHNHGCFLEFQLDFDYKADDLFALVKPLASIA